MNFVGKKLRKPGERGERERESSQIKMDKKKRKKETERRISWHGNSNIIALRV
jgi:hypothetical protein